MDWNEAGPKCYGALNFIMAFYDPKQRHLDTNAWKRAEASAKHVLEQYKSLFYKESN